MSCSFFSSFFLSFSLFFLPTTTKNKKKTQNFSLFFSKNLSNPNDRLVKKGDRLLLMPNRAPVTVAAIHRDDIEVSAARGGENLRLRLAGVDEDEVQAGFVLCSRRAPVPCVTYFDAQLQILDLLEHKAIFTAGYKVS